MSIFYSMMPFPDKVTVNFDDGSSIYGDLKGTRELLVLRSVDDDHPERYTYTYSTWERITSIESITPLNRLFPEEVPPAYSYPWRSHGEDGVISEEDRAALEEREKRLQK